jgi:hypothetical protein
METPWRVQVLTRDGDMDPCHDYSTECVLFVNLFVEMSQLDWQQLRIGSWWYQGWGELLYCCHQVVQGMDLRNIVVQTSWES